MDYATSGFELRLGQLLHSGPLVSLTCISVIIEGTSCADKPNGRKVHDLMMSDPP